MELVCKVGNEVIYTSKELFDLIEKAIEVLGSEADKLPLNMTIAELDKLVNGSLN